MDDLFWEQAPPPEPETEPVAACVPLAESRYKEAATRELGSSDLVLVNGSGLEIGVRALADIAVHSPVPRNHGGLVDLTAAMCNGARVVWDEGSYWFWDRDCGVWVEVSGDVLDRYILSYSGMEYGDLGKGGRRKRVQLEVSKLRSAASLAQAAVKREGTFSKAPEGMQFLDAFLWYDATAGCLRREVPRPGLYQRFQYPYPCPDESVFQWPVDDVRWKEWCPPLFHILEGSILCPETSPGVWDRSNWRAIQQRFGLALFRLSSRVRGSHLWFVGPKGTGKNTITMAFSSLFPPETRTSVQINEVQEYRTMGLATSRINMLPEVNHVRSVGYFKDALTDGLIPVRAPQVKERFIPPRFFQVCASNGTPEIETDADSVLDRFCIIPFKRFPGKPQPYLREEMEHYAQGLVAWALAGFCSWMWGDPLEAGSMSDRLKAAWARAGDPVAQWAVERLRRLQPGEGEHWVAICPVAWHDYREWAEEANVDRRKVGTLERFRSKIREIGLPIELKGKERLASIVGHCLKVTGSVS